MVRRINQAAIAAAALLLSLPSSALADPLREFCPDRPGKDTPPCIVDRGHVVIETSALTYSRERDGSRYEVGEPLVRYGLADTVELQLNFTPYVIARQEEADGSKRTLRGVGDLTGAVKVNLRNPDGSGTSAAVQAFVTAPTGKDGIGSGKWEGGVLVPLSFELSDKLGLALTPEVDWLADEEGSGHHLAVAGVASLSRELADGLVGSVELWSQHHREPGNKRTEASLDFALAWQPSQRKPVQFDIEVDVGLNRHTPKTEVTGGVAMRF